MEKDKVFDYIVESHAMVDNYAIDSTTLYPPHNVSATMTKGHVHLDDSDEVYYFISGRGYLLLKDIESGEEKLIPVKEHSSIHIEPHMAHRVINCGKSNLKFICIHRSETEKDYNIDFKFKI